MKIYILRHEHRTNDCSFFSPLTELGLDNANKLVPILDKLDIISFNNDLNNYHRVVSRTHEINYLCYLKV